MILTNGLGIGGAEVVVRDLVQSIDAARFNVSICCLKSLGPIGKALAEQGFDIATLPRVEPRDGKDSLTFRKLRKVVKAKRIDIVHSHTTYAFTDACLCKLTMPWLKVVHTFHFGNYPHRDRSTLWAEGLCSRVADGLISVGDVQGRQIRSIYRLRERQMRTIRNGVRRPGGGDCEAFRTQVVGRGQVLIGTLANLIDQKGLPDLLRVARRVRDLHEGVRFVIVGEGKLRGELERLRGQLGLEDTVLFAGWMSNAADTVLPIVDVYFQPSLWEAMSIALLEAMAAGKPVVATNVGEAPFVIRDGLDGILTAPRDIVGMADAICRLIDDLALRRRLGESAAERVAEEFTVAHMTRAYEKFYVDVLGCHDAS